MSIELRELLIKCVQKYPCLWDNRSKLYNRRKVTEDAWEDISKICGKPVQLCRDKWKNVRTGFLRSLTKQRRFYLYDSMRFLLPVISTRQNESSLESQSSQQEMAVKIINQSLHSYSVGDHDTQYSDGDGYKVFKIEQDSYSEISAFDELDRFENVTGQVTTPNKGYFSQFDSFQNETSFKQETIDFKVSNLSSGSRNGRKRGWNLSLVDHVPSTESKEEEELLSFFKGIASDVLSLSKQNQRFFKRKMVELIDDLHREG